MIFQSESCVCYYEVVQILNGALLYDEAEMGALSKINGKWEIPIERSNLKMRLEKTIATFVFVLLLSILDPAGAAEDKLDLKLRLKPGEKHGMKINSTQNISQTIIGKEHEIVYTRNFGIEAEAKQVDADGIASIEIIFRTLKETTTIEGITRGYDSTKPQSPDDNMAQMYSAMMGEGFIARVTPQGKIVTLELDKMYLGMANKMMESEDKMIKNRTKGRAQEAIERLNKRYGSREKRKQALKQQIEQFPVFSEERIRSIAINTIAVFPHSPVQIGDSWKDRITVDLLALIEVDSIHTLEKHEDGTVTINVRAKRSLDDKPIVTKIGSLKSSTTLAGSYDATIKVDEKSGWLISKRADMRFTGETTLPGNKQTPQRQKMQMSVKATVTVEPMKSASDN